MKATLKNNVLTLEIPFDAAGTVSGSGKSTIHASTHGNQAIAIAGDVFSVGVNVYKKIQGASKGTKKAPPALKQG